jgi:F-type H+-transporting ATPase subunit b
MSRERTKGGLPFWAVLIIGIALMVAGWYVHRHVTIGFVEALREAGIPLDPGKTISAIGVLIIVFPVIRFFFLNALADAIRERTTNLERAFAEAENLRSEMAQMKREYEAQLVAAESAAREQIQAQIREAQELRGQLMAEAAERAEQLVARAQEEIAHERDRVLTELRAHVVDLTLTATERLLGESVDDAKNRRLVEDFIAKVEAPA